MARGIAKDITTYHSKKGKRRGGKKIMLTAPKFLSILKNKIGKQLKGMCSVVYKKEGRGGGGGGLFQDREEVITKWAFNIN